MRREMACSKEGHGLESLSSGWLGTRGPCSTCLRTLIWEPSICAQRLCCWKSLALCTPQDSEFQNFSSGVFELQSLALQKDELHQNVND